jgi:hypothetical protein
MEKLVRALIAVLLLLGIGAAVAAYHGMFYITGSQFYEACSHGQAKEKIDVALKKPGRTIQAKLLSGVAALLSSERPWGMLDLLLAPRRPRQQKMHRRWRGFVRMRALTCQCSLSFGTLLQFTPSRRMEDRR